MKAWAALLLFSELRSHLFYSCSRLSVFNMLNLTTERPLALHWRLEPHPDASVNKRSAR